MALFGSSRKPRLNLDNNTQQAIDSYASMPPAPSEPERPSSFWRGGDKFRWQDGLAGILAAAGDALSERSGIKGGAVNMLAGGRMDALELARKAREGQQTLTDLIASGLTPQQARVVMSGKGKIGDFNQQQAPYRFEDNAGNVWQIGADGQPTRIFTDRIPKMYIQGDQAVQVPNPFADEASSGPPPSAPVGKLRPIGGPTQSASGGFRSYRR